MPAILNDGLTAIRDVIATSLVTHVGVSTDQTAFAATQTELSPDAGAVDLIKLATSVAQDFQTTDYTIEIDGDTEFTNQTIWTIGLGEGGLSSDALTRTVRSQGIGVQAGDSFTIGVRLKVEDNSA